MRENRQKELNTWNKQTLASFGAAIHFILAQGEVAPGVLVVRYLPFRSRRAARSQGRAVSGARGRGVSSSTSPTCTRLGKGAQASSGKTANLAGSSNSDAKLGQAGSRSS